MAQPTALARPIAHAPASDDDAGVVGPDAGPDVELAADYAAIHAALQATARGCAFLAEHERRSRSADTLSVLTAVERLGARLHEAALPKHAPEYLHLSLVAMSGLIAAVETDMAALDTGARAGGAETFEASRPRVARLSATLRDLGDCVRVMLDSFNRPTEAPAPQDVPAAPQRPMQEKEEEKYAAAPNEEDHTKTKVLPRATWPDGSDPLAPLRALSEPERIALFS